MKLIKTVDSEHRIGTPGNIFDIPDVNLVTTNSSMWIGNRLDRL